MFFYLSKIFWAVAAPSGLIGLALAAALLAMAAGRVRAGRNLLVFALAAYAIAGWAPLGQALLRPLEDRFVRPANLPAPPVGILVLGGGIDEVMGAARNTSELTEQGGRMTEAVRLAKLYPDARLLFTGGSAALTGSTVTEAAAARRFFIEQGIAPERIELEDASRNTHENAVNVKKIAAPRAGDVWLLVTSAYHMPRAIGIFRKADFPVTAWPADYSTLGTSKDFLRPNLPPSKGLKLTDRAVREWIGLLAYRISGRASALLPAPDQ